MSDPLAGLAPAWLRANCPCGQCRDARSGQRLVSITDVPADAGLAAVAVTGDEVAVTFSPERARSWPRSRPGRTRPAPAGSAAGTTRPRIPRPSIPRYATSCRCSAA